MKSKQDYRNLISDCMDQAYISGCGQSARDIIISEYGHARNRTNTSAEWLKDYLQGLPSLCTVPFENHAIIEWLGIDSDAIEEDYICNAIDQYWLECGKALYYIVFGSGSKANK